MLLSQKHNFNYYYQLLNVNKLKQDESQKIKEYLLEFQF